MSNVVVVAIMNMIHPCHSLFCLLEHPIQQSLIESSRATLHEAGSYWAKNAVPDGRTVKFVFPTLAGCCFSDYKANSTEMAFV
jgi:hypothetical protein